MQKFLSDVLKFQTSFAQEVNSTPTLVNLELSKLRYDLMKEENEEYLEAVENNDLIGCFDALGDMLYILCGSILTHGGQDIIEKVFTEIQRSNMSKLDEDGFPVINGQNGVLDESRPLGKVLKPAHYSRPNLRQFFNE